MTVAMTHYLLHYYEYSWLIVLAMPLTLMSSMHVSTRIAIEALSFVDGNFPEMEITRHMVIPT